MYPYEIGHLLRDGKFVLVSIPDLNILERVGKSEERGTRGWNESMEARIASIAP